MARSDDDRRRWVDGKLARLTPDSGWTPDVSRGLEQLGRADRVRHPWRVWTAAAVTATILFAIPNPTLRALAHKCGVFVARVAGFDQSRPSIVDLTLKGFDGQATKLSASRGRVVVLTIWPPTCGRCQTERSWFDEFQREYRVRGLSVLDASLEHDGPALGVSVPTTLILDRAGGVAVTHTTFCSKAEYRQDIEKLLAE